MSCTSLESAALSSLAVAARCALWCSSNGSNSSNIVTYPYNSRVSTAYKCSLVPLLLLLLLLLLLASRKGGCKILPGAVHENARTDPWSWTSTFLFSMSCRSCVSSTLISSRMAADVFQFFIKYFEVWPEYAASQLKSTATRDQVGSSTLLILIVRYTCLFARTRLRSL